MRQLPTLFENVSFQTIVKKENREFLDELILNVMKGHTYSAHSLTKIFASNLHLDDEKTAYIRWHLPRELQELENKNRVQSIMVGSRKRIYRVGV